MIKRFLIGFTVLISIFLFTNKVSAEENVIIDCSNGFSSFCSGTFTSDNLNTIIELNNIDTSVYSNVLLLFNYKDRSKFNYFYIFFYSSESQINFYNENNIFIDGPALYLTFSKYNGLVDLSSLNYSNVTSLTNGQLQLNFTIKSIAYNGSISDISNISSSKDPAIDTENKVITIPIDYFYNDGIWQNYYLYFSSPSINNMNYSFTFSYDNDLSGLPSLPIELFLNDKVENVSQYMANIQNSNYNSENGYGGGFTLDAGNFGGGGGGGRFDDDSELNSCMSTRPFTYYGSFPNENIFGLLAFSLNSCSDLVGKTPSDFSTKSIKISYDARIIDLSTDPSGPSSDAIEDMLEDIRNEYELEKEEEIKFDIFRPILKLINDKLPIINQFSQILNQFNFNEEINEPPVFKVNIPYFNLNDIEVFNFQFFIPYRDYLIDLQCLFLAFFTGFKIYKIVKGYFGGETNE